MNADFVLFYGMFAGRVSSASVLAISGTDFSLKVSN